MDSEVRIPKHKRVPRGKGYDKAAMKKHVKALSGSKTDLTKYCRSKKLSVQHFATVAAEHFPEWWAEFIEKDPAELRPCDYCQDLYYPNSARQTFCTSYCSRHAKTDREYFSGNRLNGVGVKERICQLCGKSIETNLQVHHVYGKMKDTEDEWLVALHSGCHEIIEKLSIRRYADDVEIMVKLLAFVWKKRHGWDNPELDVEITLTVEVV